MKRLTLVLMLSAVVADFGWASDFAVNPIQIEMSAARETQLVTIRNQSDGPMRVQITAFEWSQSATEPVVLKPTAELAYFPRLLSLAPGQSQNVRLGALKEPGAVEKTYRIFFEELPPAATEVTGETSTVKILAKLGVPVFVKPNKGGAALGIAGFEVSGGEARVAIENKGAIHGFVERVHFTGDDAAGKQILDQAANGWYVLAGATQSARAAIDAAVCPRLKTLKVEVVSSGQRLEKEVPVTPALCRE